MGVSGGVKRDGRTRRPAYPRSKLQQTDTDGARESPPPSYTDACAAPVPRAVTEKAVSKVMKSRSSGVRQKFEVSESTALRNAMVGLVASSKGYP